MNSPSPKRSQRIARYIHNNYITFGNTFECLNCLRISMSFLHFMSFPLPVCVSFFFQNQNRFLNLLGFACFFGGTPAPDFSRHCD